MIIFQIYLVLYFLSLTYFLILFSVMKYEPGCFEFICLLCFAPFIIGGMILLAVIKHIKGDN